MPLNISSSICILYIELLAENDFTSPVDGMGLLGLLSTMQVRYIIVLPFGLVSTYCFIIACGCMSKTKRRLRKMKMLFQCAFVQTEEIEICYF